MLNIKKHLSLTKLTLDGTEWTGDDLASQYHIIRNWLQSFGVTKNSVLLLPGVSNGTLTFLTPVMISLNASVVLTPPINAQDTPSFIELSSAEWICTERPFTTDEIEECGICEIAGVTLHLYKVFHTTKRLFRGNGAVYFTSGTTAASRAVFRDWGKLFAEVKAYQNHLKLSAGNGIVALVPLFHSFGFGSALINSLSLGAHLHCTSQMLPALLRRILMKPHYDLAIASPQTLWLCVQAHDGISETCTIDHVISSGAPLSLDGANSAKKHLGWMVKQQYGSSETGAISVSPQMISDSSSVGQPLEGVTVRISDSGEITVVSDYAAAGYLQDNARGRFLNGVFHPGDSGYFTKAGELVLTGRIDDEVTVSGKRIRLQGLQCFLQDIPGVELARISKVEQDRSVQMLHVELYGSVKISYEEIIEAVREKFGTCPLQIQFCKSGDLSITGVVK